MKSPILPIVLAATALAGFPATAGGKDPTVNVCHRTGQKAPAGFFRGHVLSLPTSGAKAHLGHGDLPIGATAMRFFVSSKACLIKGGQVYDENGNPTDEPPPPPPPPPGIAPVEGGEGGSPPAPPTPG